MNQEAQNARRERIAEKLMLRMAIGYRGDPYKLPEYAWALADKFLSRVSAPTEQSARPPHLPDHVRAIVQERDAARAEVERLLRLMPPTARGITNGPGEGSWAVFAEKVVEERDAARQTLARIEQWARAHGAALNPHGRADTFGEGVRESKEQVQRLLKGRHDL